MPQASLILLFHLNRLSTCVHLVSLFYSSLSHLCLYLTDKIRKWFPVARLTAAAVMLFVTVEATKCACTGGKAKSQEACFRGGHAYTNSCGFGGCCLGESEVEGFVTECQNMGEKFKQCDNCFYC